MIKIVYVLAVGAGVILVGCGPSSGPVSPTPVAIVTPTTTPTDAPTAVPTAVPATLPTDAPTAVPTIAPTATAAPTKQTSIVMSVPFGLYAAAEYNTQIASMRMKSDGTYSMFPNQTGIGIVNPERGQKGVYQVVSATQIRFVSGAYAGLLANLDPNHSGRTYIDVLLANGHKQSYEYLNPEPSPLT